MFDTQSISEAPTDAAHAQRMARVEKLAKEFGGTWEELRPVLAAAWTSVEVEAAERELTAARRAVVGRLRETGREVAESDRPLLSLEVVREAARQVNISARDAAGRAKQAERIERERCKSPAERAADREMATAERAQVEEARAARSRAAAEDRAKWADEDARWRAESPIEAERIGARPAEPHEWLVEIGMAFWADGYEPGPRPQLRCPRGALRGTWVRHRGLAKGYREELEAMQAMGKPPVFDRHGQREDFAALRKGIRRSARRVRAAQYRAHISRAEQVARLYRMPVEVFLAEAHHEPTRNDDRADALLAELDELRARAKQLAQNWKRQSYRTTRWPEGAIQRAFREFHAEHGRWPQRRELDAPGELPASSTVRARFGSIEMAREASAP